jgi:hypothetical protein
MLMAMLVTFSVLVTVVNFYSATAMAHDWYPLECCNSQNCAPVLSMAWSVPTGVGMPVLVVRSKHGTVSVPADFPVRQSKDSRMHVCMRQNELGSWDAMRLFMPPPA